MSAPGAEVFLITLEEHQLGHDLRLFSDKATVGDVLEALAAFAAERLADCRGCDGCCHERAPLTAPDVLALSALLPAGEYPLQAACLAYAEVFADKNGIVDITLRRDAEGGCLFLNKEGKYCKNWAARPFVCRSHFCLPRSSRLEDLRAAIANRGENELIRLLLEEQAAGAPAFLPLTAELSQYPPDTAFAAGGWEAIRVKDIVPPKLWPELRECRA
ncbi:MAG: YkgJ family cysteine cluster protein [Clostridiales bacterium]|nr:YkgJ family cysteine cluster protein [Clostridiales bacterium]